MKSKNFITQYNKKIMQEMMAEYTPKKINEMMDSFGVTSGRRRAIIHKLVPNQKRYLISESFTSVSALQTHAEMIVPMMVRAMSDIYMIDVIGVQPQKKSSGYAYGIFIRPTGRPEVNGSVTGTINKTNSLFAFSSKELNGTTDPLAELTEVTLAVNTTSGGGGTAGASHGVKIAGITIDGHKILLKVTDFASATLDQINADINNPLMFVEFTIGSTLYNLVSSSKDVDMLTQTLSNYSGVKETSVLEDPTFNANQVTVEMTKTPYVAKSRKLKANYSQESIADAMNDNGVDIRELGDEAMAELITKETDRHIYSMLVSTAKVVSDFDYSSYSYHTQDNTKTMNLVGKINKESSRLAKTSRVGRGNVVVCTNTVMSAIEQLESFQKTTVYTETGEGFRGTLNGIRYYVNLDDDESNGMRVTITAKGTGEHKAGLILIPYIPIQLAVGQGEDSGHEKVIMSSRYDLIENIYKNVNFTATFEVKNLTFLG
jgi:hypothetical protein